MLTPVLFHAWGDAMLFTEPIDLTCVPSAHGIKKGRSTSTVDRTSLADVQLATLSQLICARLTHLGL